MRPIATRWCCFVYNNVMSMLFFIYTLHFFAAGGSGVVVFYKPSPTNKWLKTFMASVVLWNTGKHDLNCLLSGWFATSCTVIRPVQQIIHYLCAVLVGWLPGCVLWWLFARILTTTQHAGAKFLTCENFHLQQVAFNTQGCSRSRRRNMSLLVWTWFMDYRTIVNILYSKVNVVYLILNNFHTKVNIAFSIVNNFHSKVNIL